MRRVAVLALLCVSCGSRSGLEVRDLIELQPPANASTPYPFVTREWARQWPCEEIWKARKTR